MRTIYLSECRVSIHHLCPGLEVDFWKHLGCLETILGSQSWVRPEYQIAIEGLLGISMRGEEAKGEAVWSVVCPADWPHGCWVLAAGVEGSGH